MHQMKEQDKTQEKQLNEVEIGNLPEKEFRIMIMKMIQDLGKRTEAKIKKMQEKLENSFTETKAELKAKDSRMNNAEERISDLEDKIMEITQSEEQTESQIEKKKQKTKTM